MTKSRQAQKEWSQFHEKKVKENYPQWPNETMVKVIFGNYLDNKINITEESKILEVGCGFGNNLLPFLKRGCPCYGVEISESIVALTQQIIREHKYSAIIKQGNNTDLPFQDDYFDLIISNVLHYEKEEKSIQKALAEYCRVLKTTGALYLETTGPEHDIYKNAEVVGPHQFRIKNYDFRDGEQFFYFSNLKYLEYYLSKFFNYVELGRVTEKLMSITIDSLIAVCRKKCN